MFLVLIAYVGISYSWLLCWLRLVCLWLFGLVVFVVVCFGIIVVGVFGCWLFVRVICLVFWFVYNRWTCVFIWVCLSGLAVFWCVCLCLILDWVGWVCVLVEFCVCVYIWCSFVLCLRCCWLYFLDLGSCLVALILFSSLFVWVGLICCLVFVVAVFGCWWLWLLFSFVAGWLCDFTLTILTGLVSILWFCVMFILLIGFCGGF